MAFVVAPASHEDAVAPAQWVRFPGAAADPLSQGPPLRVSVSLQRCRYRPGGAGATVVSGTSGPFWSPS
jgi:hypothetical protein